MMKDFMIAGGFVSLAVLLFRWHWRALKHGHPNAHLLADLLNRYCADNGREKPHSP